MMPGLLWNLMHTAYSRERVDESVLHIFILSCEDTI